VSRVTVGLVGDVEKNWIERRLQTRDNSLLHRHDEAIPIGTRFAGFCRGREFRACPTSLAVIKVMAWI
jgi:hypothetical protein